MIKREAPAKLNLFLRIVRRRDDGYHEIETLFQRIGLYDHLIVSPNESEEFELLLKGMPLDREGIENNIVTRAYKAIVAYMRCSPGGVRIELEKIIPAGGGLGGGSSDAAAALDAIVDALGLAIPQNALRKIALDLGADVPFFLGPPTAIGQGLGERLTPVSLYNPYWAVLAFPEMSISTAEAYSRFSPENGGNGGGNLQELILALQRGDHLDALGHMHNDMEILAFEIDPHLEEIRFLLEDQARQIVRMSGSGSTLFTLANSRQTAAMIAMQWEQTLSIRTAIAPFLLK